MSRLVELIQQLCPDGVEYKTIGQCCDVSAGGDVPKDRFSENCEGEYIIPIISNGIGENSLYGYTDIPKINGPAVTVAARGTIGYTEYRSYSYFPIIRLLSLIPNNLMELDTKFLYYALQGRKYTVPTTGIPQLTAPNIKKEKIPCPPLKVQQEIVRILDQFTELTAELTAELIARKKQYEYYRDELFRTAKNAGIYYLNEISENCDNQRKPVTSGNRIAGEYPYYGASGIVDYVDDYIFDGDYLLISEDGANLLARSTPIAFSISGKNWVNNHAHVLYFDTYETRRYVEIYLNSIDLSPYITGGAQPKLNQKNLNKIPIPLPAPGEQRRIVSILDRFDALCNDLTSGLPAEIEARRKQYEYYRDKLLTFQELEA